MRLPAGGPRLLLIAGAVVAAVAAVASPSAASSAASQAWPPFVLVAGLLLVGLVAAEDRLFEAAGERLAGASRDGRVLFAGVAVLVMCVSALLNLDTSVAFLTPVLVHTSRRRGDDEAVLLSACLLLSNAGSLLLPGSNLTNLIVLGHLHLSGIRFTSRMGVPWLIAGVVTAIVTGVAGRDVLRRRVDPGPRQVGPVFGAGALAVAAVAVVVVLTRAPALPVLAVGVLAAGWGITRRSLTAGSCMDVLGIPVLLGLLGIAVGLGTLGRDWSGPADLLRSSGPWATAAISAGSAIVLNNLPSASLLAARAPTHPYSMLIGLNLGPNVFVTGSLSWILWLRAARTAGARPPVKRTVTIGAVAAPLSIAAAVFGLLLVSGKA